MNSQSITEKLPSERRMKGLAELAHKAFTETALPAFNALLLSENEILVLMRELNKLFGFKKKESQPQSRVEVLFSAPQDFWRHE